MSWKVQDCSREQSLATGGAHPLGLLPPTFWGHPPPSLEGEQYGLSRVLVRFLTDCAVAGAALILAGPGGGRGLEYVPGPGLRLSHNAQRYSSR